MLTGIAKDFSPRPPLGNPSADGRMREVKTNVNATGRVSRSGWAGATPPAGRLKDEHWTKLNLKQITATPNAREACENERC